MKKFLAIMLAALLLFCMVGLVSCNNDKTEEEGGTDNTTNSEEELVYNNFKYAVNESGAYEIVGYVHDGATPLALELPSIINDREVTGIGAGAFKAMKNLVSISFPKENCKYTYIAQTAFYNCTSLESIALPDTITTIGSAAFKQCEKLESVTFSKALTDIDSYAFQNCKVLKNIVLPESLITIGEGAFSDCDALTTVEIPVNVTLISRGAFVNCARLDNVVLKNEEDPADTNDWYKACLDSDGKLVTYYDNGTKTDKVKYEETPIAPQDSYDLASILTFGHQLARFPAPAVNA